MESYILHDFKKVLWVILITAIMSAVILQVKGDSVSAAVGDKFKYNGIAYTIITEPTGGDKGTVEVALETDVDSSYSGDIIIPATVTNGGNTYDVIAIGKYAFSNCTSLTSVQLPNSIKDIRHYAFYGCTGLNSIIIPKSVNYIGEWVFRGSGIINMVIPNSVTYIGSYAFDGCKNLTNIVIPNIITSIEGNTFRSCSMLTSITIPSSVTSIGDLAFAGCSSLRSVYFDGNKPNWTTESYLPFSGCPSDMKYYYKSGSMGFPSDASYIQSSTYNITVSGFVNQAIGLSTNAGIPGEAISLYPAPGYTLTAENLKYNGISISGTSFIMPLNDVTITDSTNSFEKIPVPSVTVSSSEMENTMPTWGWSDATGYGYYRYKLDNAAEWTNTSSESYTPQASLYSGTHTLYVEEMNSMGDWSDMAQGTIKIKPVLTSLAISSGSLSYDPSMIDYNVNVDNNTGSVMVTTIVNDSSATIKITSDGIDYASASGSTSESIPLNAGIAKEIHIIATSKDKTATTKTYTIIVTRAKSNDAALKSLTLSSGTLNSAFTGTITSYTAAVGNEVESITVTPIVNEANAAVTVNGSSPSQAVNLNVGENTISILVTAQDGTTKTYTIIVTRASNDASLSSLTLSSGTLSPEFTGSTTGYTAIVGNEVTNIIVTPTVNETHAAVTVNENQASQAVNLNVGENTINVVVTAQDGTTKTYTITVTRAKSNDASLSNLTLSNGTLNAAFTGATTSYTANVGNEVTSITLTPTANEANAAVTVNGSPVSQAVNLNVGANTINVVVTAQDGTTTKTYTITVTRAASNDAALKSLTLSSGTLSPEFTGTTTSYTAAVGNGVTSITVTPTANEANAAVTVNGNPVSQAVNLNVGDNTITVAVAAQDGTKKTYTITVKRAAPYIPPYTPTQPTTETRQVPVLVGNGGQQSTAVQATITRITGSDGSKKDTVVLDESTAAATVKKALEVESTNAVIAITDISGDNADKTEAQIPSASMAQFASNNMSLIIETGKASLELPAETIKESEGQDIKVQVSEEKESSKIEEDKGLILQLVSGAQIITAPLNIEANITGRVKVTIPVDSSKLPTSKEELDKFLSSLAVMVHHSDGENVVDKGTIVYDEEGNIVGISVWVDKFSSFILISLPENYFQGRTTVMKNTVDADKKWQIKFTKPADAATVTKNNVYVVNSKGIKVEAEISYGSDNLLKVTPVELYKSGETYYLYITKGVKAKDGTSLVNELRYQFTVK
ncbi:cadherin-like beta sandwich domain-containing protein [Clostridium kluyveri]|uniref:cadherin-like beta sandwich domain-containing protein n=1 Tax=Clostridium kluyveri TaxID=1534 RepID=UPI002246F281|nr:cadherin-like beta sandwich domain-containing protein [Clostridium kluyveri]UZQ50261.1 cadherin-like beta sandwich domain-containing protein [Clostridium kluyveri]